MFTCTSFSGAKIMQNWPKACFLVKLKNAGKDIRGNTEKLEGLFSCLQIAGVTRMVSNTGTLQISSNTGFVIQELDSVQFLDDIIFCLESESIVVSFSSSTGFL